MAPTEKILVARENDGKRQGCIMRWGLIPSSEKDKKMAQINARADTAADKPRFRSAFKKRRCLILAEGWYEWKANAKQKQPFFFRMKKDEPMLFAALWEKWDDEDGPTETCAILTTYANDLTKQLHNRMPVILTGDDALAWIEPGDDKDKLKDLLQPFSPDGLAYHAVNTAVGNVRNSSPDCIEPV